MIQNNDTANAGTSPQEILPFTAQAPASPAPFTPDEEVKNALLDMQHRPPQIPEAKELSIIDQMLIDWKLSFSDTLKKKEINSHIKKAG